MINFLSLSKKQSYRKFMRSGILKAYPSNRYAEGLKFISLADIANSSVKFDKKGDGLPRYIIYNYQKDLATGKTDYKVRLITVVIIIIIIIITGEEKAKKSPSLGNRLLGTN